MRGSRPALQVDGQVILHTATVTLRDLSSAKKVEHPEPNHASAHPILSRAQRHPETVDRDKVALAHFLPEQ